MQHSKNENKHKTLLWQWFTGLSLEERAHVVLWEDKQWTAILKQMYKKKWREGDGFFFNVDDPGLRKLSEIKRGSNASFVLPTVENFSFKKLSLLDNYFCFPEAVVAVDKQLEENVRLCDTREYCDTLTVSSALLVDAEKFLSMMEVVTRGGFLTSPCRVTWHEKTRTWEWGVPDWFEGMGFYSLGTYVAHKLEQCLWRRYWQANNLDPRVAPTGGLARGQRDQMYPLWPNMQGLHTKTHLTNYWNSLSVPERRRMVGTIGDIVEDVLVDSKTQDWQKPLSTLLDLLLTLLDQDSILGFTQPDSFSQLRDESDKDFIEFVYFSPMHRAFEPLDLIVRRMGKFIQSAYTEKIAMDLILGEEKDKRKKGGKNKKGKKAKPNKKDRKKGRRDSINGRKGSATPAKKPEDTPSTSCDDITEMHDDSDSGSGSVKKKSRSFINGKAQPTIDESRQSKSQPGSPRLLPSKKRRCNSSPLTPEAQDASNPSPKNAVTPPKKLGTQRVPKNGTMLLEGLQRVGQSKDDCNIRARASSTNGDVSTTQSSNKRKRRRKRNRGLSASVGTTSDGGDRVGLSQSGGHSISIGVQTHHIWGGSVSDSAVGEDGDLEDESSRTPSIAPPHNSAYQVIEIPKRKIISPVLPSLMPNAPFSLRYEDYEDFAEDADIESMGSMGDEEEDDVIDDGNDGLGDEERFWYQNSSGELAIPGLLRVGEPVDAEVMYDESLESEAIHNESSPHAGKMISLSDSGERQPYDTEIDDENDELNSSQDSKATSQDEEHTSTEDISDLDISVQLPLSRGRSRMRSSSIGQIDGPTQQTIVSPRRSRARSQPPANESPQKELSAGQSITAHSLPELQSISTCTNSKSTIETPNNTIVGPVASPITSPATTPIQRPKRTNTRPARDTGTSADDLSCMQPTYSRKNALTNSSQSVRTRPARYVYRRSLSEIVQEERDKAERTRGRGVQWNHPGGPPRVVSGPFPPYARSPPERANDPSAGVGIICAGRGTAPMAPAPAPHPQHPTSPLHLLRPQSTDASLLSYNNQPQASRYSRVSHLLTQSLSDVERVLFLHREIEDIVQHIATLTAVQRVLQEKMLGKMRSIIKNLWGDVSRVECYGSFATSLGIPSSDLDLVVILPHPSPSSDPSSDSLLKRDWSPIRILAEELKKHEWLQSIQAIETAKVPVIKLVGRMENKNVLVDITFTIQSPPSSVPTCAPPSQPWEHMNFQLAIKGQPSPAVLDEHSGIAASKLVRSYMRSLPALTPLALVLKQFLYERGLNNTYTGGISSYCLVLMIVAFLRLNMPHSRRPKTTDKAGPSSELSEDENLGGALIGFLRFFGLQFDFDKMGISLNSPTGATYFYLREPCNTLVIMDPLAPDRNIGHSVFGMWRVKAAFRYAFSALISPYTTNYAPTLISRILHGPTMEDQELDNDQQQQSDSDELHLPAWVPLHAAYLHPELSMAVGGKTDMVFTSLSPSSSRGSRRDF